jgi:lipid-binding SYLF domain-containing protein
MGASSSDFVLLVMDQKAVDALLNGKTKLGRDPSVAAGPSGAITTSTVGGADMLCYGRTKGLFAGTSLGGANIEPDDSANRNLYGKPVTAREVLLGGSVKPPAAAEPLVQLLNTKMAQRAN